MSSKKIHPLLSALVGELEKGDPWPLERRVTWLRMAAMAFDLVHGQQGAIDIRSAGLPPLSVVVGEPTVVDLDGATKYRSWPASAIPALPATPEREKPRLDRPLQGDQVYFVDLSGRVFGRDLNDFGVPIGLGKRVSADALPGDATLWDMRPGEASLGSLEWADGTRGAPLLPVQVLTG